MAVSRIFIDTGAFLAAELPRDQFYQRSRQAWGELSILTIRLYSSEAVFQEMTTLLHHRDGSASALQWCALQLESKSITWLPINAQVRKSALPWMKKYADQHISFVDATSFVLMRQENIRHVFGFDHHFVSAGFRIWPD